MKRGEPIKGWRESLPKINQRPEGYSTAEEISKEIGISLRSSQDRLLNLRKSGKVDAIQVTVNGHSAWVYKD